LEAGPRRRSGDTLCVPRSDIDVGGSLGHGKRAQNSIHIMPEAAAIRFHRRRPPSTYPPHLQSHCDVAAIFRCPYSRPQMKPLVG
ncbi:hypothetical protein THAOC_30782, partial [Thalassiosira oceanica]